MYSVSDEQFESFVQAAVAAIPPRFANHLDNVAFMTADEPTPFQLESGQLLHGNEVLLGLYEGIPLPRRGDGYNGVAPDVITIFKRAHELISPDSDHLRAAVHQTVWHEVAHYFGLGHGRIHELEQP